MRPAAGAVAAGVSACSEQSRAAWDRGVQRLGWAHPASQGSLGGDGCLAAERKASRQRGWGGGLADPTPAMARIVFADRPSSTVSLTPLPVSARECLPAPARTWARNQQSAPCHLSPLLSITSCVPGSRGSRCWGQGRHATATKSCPGGRPAPAAVLCRPARTRERARWEQLDGRVPPVPSASGCLWDGSLAEGRGL